MEAIASTHKDVRQQYRRLREINQRHVSAAMESAPRQAVLDGFKRLGLLSRGAVRADSNAELVLAMDLALYSAWLGLTPIVQRYRKAVAPAPGSEEATVLDGMCRTRFRVLHVRGRHPEAGLLVKDLLAGEDLWLMDESLERTCEGLTGLAARLIPLGDFHMTTGAIVPLNGTVLVRVLLKYPDLMDGLHPDWGTSATFIADFYRSGIESGAMQHVELG